MKKFNTKLVGPTTKSQRRLGNENREGKSHIYKISCSDYNKIYTGQIKGLITTSFREHEKEAEYGER